MYFLKWSFTPLENGELEITSSVSVPPAVAQAVIRAVRTDTTSSLDKEDFTNRPPLTKETEKPYLLTK
jgi:hypothetical protein